MRRNADPEFLKIQSVQLQDNRLRLTLANGRVLLVPTEKNIPEQWRDWELTDDGHGVNWPKLGRSSDRGSINVYDLLEDELLAEAEARWSASGKSLEALKPTD